MSSYVRKKTPGDTSWFVKDRFGMFVHFGLYSLGARYEWVKTIEKTPEEKYDKYFKYFYPDMYDPKEWARQAKAAGMKYVILTAKHHEGFCLWNTKYTDYNVMNTPFGRDIIKEFVEAFRAEGMRIGFYYSLLDWHHPDYTVDKVHPRNKDQNAKALNEGRDFKRYTQFMRDQVTELLTNYGKIDILWFDYSFEGDKEWPEGKGKNEWEAEKLIETVRNINPDIIINNRLEIEQDIHTPEQYQIMSWLKDKETGELLTWEACHTFSGTWGYHRDETSWKSPEILINLLINSVSIGGNFLMNVGPTSRGHFDYRAEAGLKVYADWMKYNSRSIYGCTMAEPEFTAPRGCRLTQSEDGKRLYIHLMEYPYKFLEFPGLAGKVDYSQFLHDGSEIITMEKTFEADNISEGQTKGEDLLIFRIPPIKPNVIVPVIEVFLK